MDQEFAKYMLQFGAVGLLALVFYYQNNKNAQDYANQLKLILESERSRTDLLIRVIIDATKSITENTAVTQSFHRRLDEENHG